MPEKNDSSSPLVSVIILNYNGKDMLCSCIESVLCTDYPNFEIIIVDNNSTDGSVNAVKKRFNSNDKMRLIINERNLGYTGGNNVGIKHARGEVLVFLNNDITVSRSWLREIVEALKSDLKIGAAQPKIMNFFSPTKVDNLGGSMGFYGFAKIQKTKMHEIFFAVGSALVVRKNVLEEVGPFDDDYFMYNEDLDLSWRIRLAGYKVVLIPRAVVYHRISATVKCPDANLMWHLRKNRVTNLIKNYRSKNLLKTLPVVVIIYLFNFMTEVISKNLDIALINLYSLTYNLKNLKNIWYKRLVVQKKVRKVTDDKILKFVTPPSDFGQMLLTKFTKRHVRG